MQSHADNMGVDGAFDSLNYGYADPPRVQSAPLVQGEQDLWCAVIVQAFVDMGAIAPPTSGRRPEAPRARGKEFDEAARWLLRDKTDFPFVCDQAGLSAHIIRRAAQLFYGRLQFASREPSRLP